MTNNLDEFEQPDMEANGGAAKQGMRANLTHAWRTRPLFKLLVLMTVAAALIIVGISFFSGPKQTEVTKLSTPPGMKQARGGAATPYFIEQTKKAEAERTNTAIRTGTDVLPTPIGANASIDEMTSDKQKKDPLVELRAQIEQQKQKIAQIEQQKNAPAQQTGAKEQFDDSLAQAMQKQLQQMQGTWDAKGIREVSGKTDDKEAEREKATKEEADRLKNGGGGGGMGGSSATLASAGGDKKFGIPVINAGTISYAQMLTEANSDTQGPVLAQILSGPLKGARVIGSFQVENDYLVLKFNLANLHNIDYQIDAYALDPDTTLPGMATEVDQRYFTRVLLPAAAGFMSGFGQALGQNSSSVVTNGDTTIVQQSGKGLQQGLFTGLGQAGQTMSQFFQDQANNTKPLVRVAAGTPMGLFFLQTVCSGTGCPLADVVENRMQGNTNGNQNGNPNGYPYGYPNNGYMPGMAPGYAPGYNNGYPAGYNGNNNNALSNGTGVVGYNAPAGSNTPSTPPYSNNSSGFGGNNSSALQPNNGLNIISGSPGLGTPVLNP